MGGKPEKKPQSNFGRRSGQGALGEALEKIQLGFTNNLSHKWGFQWMVH
jgi:hypothetical protein